MKCGMSQVDLVVKLKPMGFLAGEGTDRNDLADDGLNRRTCDILPKTFKSGRVTACGRLGITRIGEITKEITRIDGKTENR